MIFRKPIYIITAFLFAFFVFFTDTGHAASSDYFIRGIVRDSISDQGVDNAFVAVDNGRIGTMTDSDGIFELSVPQGAKSLKVWSQGYEPKTISIVKNRVNLYAVYLSPEAVELNEVVVKKSKYSKKDNPAVELMQFIRKTADRNDPAKRPYYSFNTYQRTSLALNNINADSDNGLLAKFPFLYEHLDTSEISGKPILPVMVKEQSTEVFNRNKPQGRHVVVTGKRSEGIDEMLDEESMNRFTNDILGPVDIYARDIYLLQNRFVSPLSPIAADFYKFYITDSLTESDGRKFYVLSFYPHNRSAFGFTGTMEVTTSDTTAFVRKVNMRVPSDINLNFIRTLAISQEFDEAPDGSRLLGLDDMIIEAEILPGTQGLYAHRVIDYSNHNFERPADEMKIFKPKAPETVLINASQRDSLFWASVNPIGLSEGERKVGVMLDRFRKNKVFYWGEKILKIMVTGYVPTDGKNSKFDYGPVNTSVSFNSLEGVRLRAGGITTANLSRHWFTRFYGAYGFRDHKWKYGVEIEYSFNPKKRHSREFPVHSLRLNSSYDIDHPGQQYYFTNPDNVFLSLRRHGTNPTTYSRVNSLLYTLELETHFSLKLLLKNERQIESRLMHFDLSGGGRIGAFDLSSAQIELRYAPGETFYQTTSNRFPISKDKPVISLTHTLAPRGMGNYAAVNVTQLFYSQRFWLSAFGYLDVIAKGGHLWSRHTFFPNLFIANTNLSYTIQPESFALTAPMEFVADSFGSLELTYWANGALLNYIPYVRKLKLREAFSLNGFYGCLSQHNDPARTSGLILWPGCETTSQRLKTPYLEASVGLDNILRCLRVDYVWRLTHRHTPLKGSDKWGIRVALHFTF